MRGENRGGGVDGRGRPKRDGSPCVPPPSPLSLLSSLFFFPDVVNLSHHLTPTMSNTFDALSPATPPLDAQQNDSKYPQCIYSPLSLSVPLSQRGRITMAALWTLSLSRTLTYTGGLDLDHTHGSDTRSTHIPKQICISPRYHGLRIYICICACTCACTCTSAALHQLIRPPPRSRGPWRPPRPCGRTPPRRAPRPGPCSGASRRQRGLVVYVRYVSG